LLRAAGARYGRLEITAPTVRHVLCRRAQEEGMPKYLVQGSYTAEGAKGLIKDGGSKRRAAVETIVKALGGRVEAFYFAYGDTDVIVLVDLPDSASATAVALTVGASGAVRLRTTVLITPEEVDQAVKKTVQYRPPGTS
jgi:uncharacterized protein with GYD domain